MSKKGMNVDSFGLSIEFEVSGCRQVLAYALPQVEFIIQRMNFGRNGKNVLMSH